MRIQIRWENIFESGHLKIVVIRCSHLDGFNKYRVKPGNLVTGWILFNMLRDYLFWYGCFSFCDSLSFPVNIQAAVYC